MSHARRPTTTSACLSVDASIARAKQDYRQSFQPSCRGTIADNLADRTFVTTKDISRLQPSMPRQGRLMGRARSWPWTRGEADQDGRQARSIGYYANMERTWKTHFADSHGILQHEIRSSFLELNWLRRSQHQPRTALCALAKLTLRLHTGALPCAILGQPVASMEFCAWMMVPCS